MGGTLESWDGIAPALSRSYRTLRYDQRGSGLSEKVRAITTETLVADLEAVLAGEPPPAALSFRHRRGRHHAGAALHDAAIPTASRASRSAIRSPAPIRAAWRRSRSAPGWPSARACAPPSRSRSTIRGRSDIGDRARLRDLSRALPGARSGLLRRAQPLDRANQRDASRQGDAQADHGGRRPLRQGARRRPRASSSRKTIPGARFELIDAVHMMPAQAPAPLLALLQDFLGQHAR